VFEVRVLIGFGFVTSSSRTPAVLDIKSQGDRQDADVAALYVEQELAFNNSPTKGLLG
jgi:hypothetical protein